MLRSNRLLSEESLYVMSKQKSKARKYHSRLSGAIHETAAGLHRIGLMDKATMREFDRPKRRSRVSLRSTRAT
jgi:hypothetical protein